MDFLERNEEITNLFLMYEKLFTKKQCEYFKLYFFEDYSYQEIGQIKNVSKNAVYDQLKKVISALYTYEDKLKLLSFKKKRLYLLEKYEKEKNVKYLEKLKGMDIDGK